jgi:hypothetical protein
MIQRNAALTDLPGIPLYLEIKTRELLHYVEAIGGENTEFLSTAARTITTFYLNANFSIAHFPQFVAYVCP